jgi:transposase
MASPLSGRRDVERAQVLLLAEEGLPNTQIARRVRVAPATVAAWRRRFRQDGVQFLAAVRPGRGRKPSISPSTVAAIAAAATRATETGSRPPSVRSLAHDYGVSPAAVHRVLAAHGVGQKRPSHSTARQRTDGAVDAVGLYLNPPDQTLALAMNREGETHVLDRGEDLPIPAQSGPANEHSVATVRVLIAYAAIDAAAREVVGRPDPAGRAASFLAFLAAIDQAPTGGLHVHLIAANHAIQGRSSVEAWLHHRPHFRLHLVPTSAAWLRTVSDIFGRIQNTRRLRSEALPTASSLIDAIESYFGEGRAGRESFTWTRPPLN